MVHTGLRSPVWQRTGISQPVTREGGIRHVISGRHLFRRLTLCQALGVPDFTEFPAFSPGVRSLVMSIFQVKKLKREDKGQLG